MPLTEPLLWETIRAWQLPYRPERDNEASPPRTCASFEDCLRKKGHWTDESASRITEAYRRFLYLKALSGEPITPSKAIDMAWHLHLGFPEDYNALCAALDRDIPHLTRLGWAELTRASERGRTLFETEFDAPPDRDLWPSLEDETFYFLWWDIVEWAWVPGVGAGVMLGLSIGGFLGLVVAVGIALPIFAVMNWAEVRREGVTPSKMARCG